MRKAVPIVLTDEEKFYLSQVANSVRSEVLDSFRARIVLLSSEGRSNIEIAEALKTSRQTVGLWRNRFAKQGISGLKDEAGRGRKRTYGSDKVEEIITATIESKPKNMTHWSTRTMAEEMGVQPYDRAQDMEGTSVKTTPGQNIQAFK